MTSDKSKQAYTSMMKFTMDGRPFIKDVHDLFAALIVQLPLTTHKYLFRSYLNTFTTEEAINSLGSLRFSYSTRLPDPDDPNKMIRTTTTTTFNMAKDMAKALCQQFQQCRLMCNATDPSSQSLNDKTIWQLTPKGLCILQDFCIRTDVDTPKMRRHFTDIQPIQVVRLERKNDDDTVMVGRQNLAVLYIVMVHSLPLDGDNVSPINTNVQAPNAVTSLPGLAKSSPKHTNESSNSSVSSGSSASSSLPSGHLSPFAMSTQVMGGDSKVQILGNYLLTLSKSGQPSSAPSQKNGKTASTARRIRSLFSTQLACDWLLYFSTTSSYEEGCSLLAEFLRYGWIEYQNEKHAEEDDIRLAKNILMSVTSKGKQILTEANQYLDGANPNGSSKHPQGKPIQQDTPLLPAASPGGAVTDSEATLKEMLAQDPDTARQHMIPRRQNSISSTTSSNHSAQRSSRPPSIALDSASSLPNADQLIGSSTSMTAISANTTLTSAPVDAFGKETNASKLKQILDDAQMRSYFKDFLRQNFCEENLDFWIDYNTLRRKLRNQSPALPSQNQKDMLEDAYDIWATYLKPGASSELNVEHSLRQEMARVVSSMVTVVPTYLPAQQTTKNTLVISSHSVSQSLRMLLKWLDQVNDYICRLMATDSVPKFVRTPRYKKLIEQREQEQKKQHEEYLLERQKLDDSLFFDDKQS
ncbi:hypothetical protein DM01DRAFT_1406597 [Hesseltinella vesiculosa]|uniref:RGS domain-containing protein n=1 Tax=Hesseltinella vesiculosa TaxID=101127 RepID=A0A1X2GKY4_9FUNG|nr:hypothetical protein DM01DRAFT_1406597 [Hesseltinella vesiculosa]